MPKVNQLTVRCENRPGTLAHIAKVMGDANVNILGFLLTTSGTNGYVKLVVDDAEKAKETLEEAGLFYAEQVVLHARLANVPGALGRFAGKLAAKRINILSGYQTIQLKRSFAATFSILLAIVCARCGAWTFVSGPRLVLFA